MAEYILQWAITAANFSLNLLQKDRMTDGGILLLPRRVKSEELVSKPHREQARQYPRPNRAMRNIWRTFAAREGGCIPAVGSILVVRFDMSSLLSE